MATQPLIQQVERPGDVRRSEGLITGIGARRRIAEQQTLNNAGIARQQAIDARQLQIDRTADRVQAKRDQVDLDIATQNSRQELIDTELKVLERDRAMGIGLDPTRLVAVSNELRDERNDDLKPFMAKLASFDELNSVIDLTSGPASMAVLFKFIKSMDDSVVRESEGRLLTSSTGLVGEFVNKFNQAMGDGIFAPETIEDIRQTATEIAKGNFKTAEQINERHDILAGRFATQFMEPALVGLSQSARFNQDRTFGAAPGSGKTAQNLPVADDDGIVDLTQ